MFDYLKGKIEKLSKNKIVLEKFGIGFLINVPDSEKFSENDKIYTVFKIKEDELKILGFKTKEERDIFNALTQVHGVGEKVALSILSTFSVEEFQTLLEEGDLNSLTKVQGVGKKTAQRIIVELKGKLNFYEDSNLEDLVKALVNLGFDKEEAYKAAKDVLKEEKDLQSALKKAISLLSSRV
ncbi:MAG TPA: Holliday junction branch migration protein RuvA [Sulfurihydrogenibium azorense]|uniref:Holliday junction branch migration complex subunit RuvA n=1 Tax=Sulfurihydrogenibium azorense TaxID=309806 RepID=A0A831YDG9_9AQUI|nr:Holliday junction branch migration protein RuvA [Sulfurihydrogenibium azorense]